MAKAMYVGVVDNLVPNGTFDTLDGWAVNATNMVAENGYAYFAPVSTSATFQWANTEKTLALTNGHVYYMSAKYWKTGGGVSRWGLYSKATGTTYKFIPISGATNGWAINSAIYTATATAETNVLIYGNGATYSADLSMKWDDVMVIDLTALFGAGNEPTLEWCNENISYTNGSIDISGANVGKARKVKKMYVGVGNVARKVKAGYVGVSNVARKFHQSNTVAVGQAWTFTSSDTFTVPSDGSYSIELHGGGGGGGGGAWAYEASDYMKETSANGGAGGGSGELITLTLNEGEVYDITIGTGGNGGAGVEDKSYSGRATAQGGKGGDGGATSFGTHSVEGGKGGTGGYASAYSSVTSTEGKAGAASGSLASGTSGGCTDGTYGNGGIAGTAATNINKAYDGGKGKAGVVIITYLG